MDTTLDQELVTPQGQRAWHELALKTYEWLYHQNPMQTRMLTPHDVLDLDLVVELVCSRRIRVSRNALDLMVRQGLVTLEVQP